MLRVVQRNPDNRPAPKRRTSGPRGPSGSAARGDVPVLVRLLADVQGPAAAVALVDDAVGDREARSVGREQGGLRVVGVDDGQREVAGDDRRRVAAVGAEEVFGLVDRRGLVLVARVDLDLVVAGAGLDVQVLHQVVVDVGRVLVLLDVVDLGIDESGLRRDGARGHGQHHRGAERGERDVDVGLEMHDTILPAMRDPEKTETTGTFRS